MIIFAAAALAACAQAPQPVPTQPVPPQMDSVVPGTLGVLVRQEGASVVVSAVRSGSELRVGDVVLRYNGEPVSSARQFYRLVVDSRPGTLARLEVRRQGEPRSVQVPVHELDMFPRA